jgi:hypothetical protein
VEWLRQRIERVSLWSHPPVFPELVTGKLTVLEFAKHDLLVELQFSCNFG